MTALITIDHQGNRFDVHVLANEPEQKAEGQSGDQSETPNDQAIASTTNHVTTIEISNDSKNAQDKKEEATNGIVEPVLETVGELRQLIAERFDIEPESAKIIHRGKLIGNKKDERLSTLRFKNKDTIKIMGKAIKVDPGFASLKAYERNNLVKLNQQFEQNGQDLDLLEKNFLEGKNREEMIKKTERLFRSFNEAAEKHLEAIDALSIYGDNISEEQKTRNREKRKQIVDGVLQLLNLNDKYLHRLDDYKFRTEHPDEGR